MSHVSDHILPPFRRCLRPRQIRVWVLTLMMLLVPGESHATLSRSSVLTELRRIATSKADARQRFLRLWPSFNSLTPAVQRHWLERLSDHSQAGLAALARWRLLRHLPPDEASATVKSLGFVTTWLSAGPLAFSSVELSPIHRLIDASVVREGEVVVTAVAERRWRRVSANAVGAASVDDILPRERPAAALLATVIDVPREMDVLLHVGAAGSMSIALEGKIIARATGLQFGHPDQLTVPARLKAGENRLTLALTRRDDTRAQCFLRITDLQGAALPGGVARYPDGNEPWPSLADSQRLTHPPHSNRSSHSIQARVLHAVAQRALGLSGSLTTHAAESESLGFLLNESTASRLDARAFVLSVAQLDREEVKMSLLLSRAHRKEPEVALSLADLAGHRGQIARARALLGSLQKAHTKAERALRSWVRARIEAQDGESAHAWRLLRDASSEDAPSERWLRQSAEAAGNAGLHLEAVARWRQLVAALPGDVEAAGAYAHALIAVGRVIEAIAVLDKVTRMRPELWGYGLESARLSLVRGDDAVAAERAHRLAALAIHDATTLQGVASIFERLGAHAEALRLYRAALVLSPSSLELATHIERLDPREIGTEPVFQEELSEELINSPTLDPGATFEILAEEVHVALGLDNRVTRHVQRFVRVRRVPEAREARSVFIRYEPGLQAAHVLGARVHRGSLKIPVLAREHVQVSEQWYGLYYDLRETVVPFDDLRPGDIIAIQYRLTDLVESPISHHYDTLELLQDHVPKHRLRLSVTGPKTLTLNARLSVPQGKEELAASFEQGRELLSDGRQRLFLYGRNIAPIHTEALMPGNAEISATWQVSSYDSWDELVSAYDTLVKPQKRASPAMRRWVKARRESLAEEGHAPSLPRLLRSVVEGVASDIRYVGLEFGIHGYKPYRSDRVWERRFGDCKDQATLIVTLLELVGIEAQVALVRTRPEGRVPSPLPSLALFDHAIVWLPDLNMYVDPTARSYGLGELPVGNQGAQVLRLSAPATLEEIPTSPVSRTGMQGSYDVMLRDDGGASLRGTVILSGAQAPGYRERFADEDGRFSKLERLLNQRYPGFQLGDFELSDPDRLGRPFELSFSGDVPRVLSATATALEVRRPAGGLGLAQAWAGESHRDHPVVLGPPGTYVTRFRYVLSPAWEAPSLAPDREQRSAFGDFSVRWVREVGAVTVETRLRVNRDQIEAEEYPAFRTFMQAFDAATRTPLVLNSTSKPLKVEVP